MEPVTLLVLIAAGVLIACAVAGLIALKVLRTAAAVVKAVIKVAVVLGLLAGLVLAGAAAFLFLT